uniref:Uncharacterized protein n=1 Tax=Rhodosorus marinus TaxID=101924 RepID=A0A7S2ZEL1_9RHOD|mmetsp:Transcript_16839/g.68813  ORF Transcript_16839/g.68813 Transcript_16839/m.68813 type:complete len:111 (+) Transcript_16839:194-526(+)
MCVCDGSASSMSLDDLSELEFLSESEGVSKLLRLKTDEEMRTHAAKRRLKRRKKAVGGAGGVSYRELPFWNLQHRKLVQLELNLDEIKYDVGVLAGGVGTRRPTKSSRRK